MKKEIIIRILFLLASAFVMISFLLPTVYIRWYLPGMDGFGNPMVSDASQHYSIYQLIVEFAYWFAGAYFLLPVLYIACVVAFGILIISRMFDLNIPNKILSWLLIYPLIVSLISLYFFTIFGAFVLFSEIICLVLLSNNPESLFFNFRKDQKNVDM